LSENLQHHIDNITKPQIKQIIEPVRSGKLPAVAVEQINNNKNQASPLGTKEKAEEISRLQNNQNSPSKLKGSNFEASSSSMEGVVALNRLTIEQQSPSLNDIATGGAG
jgi:hypothetical protein